MTLEEWYAARSQRDRLPDDEFFRFGVIHGPTHQIRASYLKQLEELIAPPKRKKRKKDQISDEIRWEVFQRDEFTCRHCGTERGPFEADHIIPESRGDRRSFATFKPSVGPAIVEREAQ